MIEINPEEYGNQNLFKLIGGVVAPRPIAFASTIDKDGNNNLSPFSFYNAFGVNPSTLIFSPSRRGRDNTTKHTFENLKEVPEVVINAVNYGMAHQMSLSSTEYDKGIDEFNKSGFTPVKSVKIRPMRVAESPVQFECKVREIIEISGLPGSGNLVICEIVHIHLDENILDINGSIDPDKIDLIGRLGGDYYVRTSGVSKFIIPKPLASHGIGVDSLPDHIKFSDWLTGNELGQLGGLEHFPDKEEIDSIKNSDLFVEINNDMELLHKKASELIAKNRIKEALSMLLTTM